MPTTVIVIRTLLTLFFLFDGLGRLAVVALHVYAPVPHDVQMDQTTWQKIGDVVLLVTATTSILAAVAICPLFNLI